MRSWWRREADDRQNTFVQTTHDQAWKDRAKALWTPDTNEIVDKRIATGFAAILASLEVDYAFIRRPLATTLKADLIETFADDSLELWLEDVRERHGPAHEQPSWEDLHIEYRNLTRDHLSVRPKDLKEFGRDMAEKGYASSVVKKERAPGGARKSVRVVRLTVLDNVVDLAEAA